MILVKTDDGLEIPFHRSRCILGSAFGAEAAQNKVSTLRCLKGMVKPYVLVTVPASGTVPQSIIEEIRATFAVGVPLATKPVDGKGGKGVLLDVMSDEDLVAALQTSASFSTATRQVLVQEAVAKEARVDYRMLVIQGRLVAAARRLPAFVDGDGKSTVLQLVRAKNAHPWRGEEHTSPLTKINEEAAARHLGKALKDVTPAKGERVLLASVANLSQGGEAEDVTDIVHPAIERMVVEAAARLGLELAGVDLLAADVSADPTKSPTVILEVNASPGLRMHTYPSAGEARDVAGILLDACAYRARELRRQTIKRKAEGDDELVMVGQ